MRRGRERVEENESVCVCVCVREYVCVWEGEVRYIITLMFVYLLLIHNCNDLLLDVFVENVTRELRSFLQNTNQKKTFERRLYRLHKTSVNRNQPL